jgi:hypothetical protein
MNDELTVEDLKEKIAVVKQDLVNKTGRHYEVLTQYLEYLQDELEIKQHEGK